MCTSSSPSFIKCTSDVTCVEFGWSGIPQCFSPRRRVGASKSGAAYSRSSLYLCQLCLDLIKNSSWKYQSLHFCALNLEVIEALVKLLHGNRNYPTLTYTTVYILKLHISMVSVVLAAWKSSPSPPCTAPLLPPPPNWLQHACLQEWFKHQGRVPSDFSPQPPRFHSANHLRLVEECPSCVLFFSSSLKSTWV